MSERQEWASCKYAVPKVIFQGQILDLVPGVRVAVFDVDSVRNAVFHRDERHRVEVVIYSESRTIGHVSIIKQAGTFNCEVVDSGLMESIGSFNRTCRYS